MREILQYILENYKTEKANAFKGNCINQYLKEKCENSFLSTGVLSKANYKVKYSLGQGQWANVPWIAIFDRDISLSATAGYDIVYLFSSDMEKVYLSLNQGWTHFKETYKGKKEAFKKINTVRKMWRKKLKSDLGEFDISEISLGREGNIELAQGYEAGHICGKCYLANNMPDESVLRSDLQSILALFRELKGNMIKNEGDYSFIDTNNYLLTEAEFSLLNNEERTSSDKSLEQIISDEGKNTKLSVSNEVPKEYEDIERGSGQYNHLKQEKIDYDEKSKKQQRIGLAGEYMVLNYEKVKLNDLDIKKPIEHISKTKGDSAGYDIQSYDKNGKEIHIEVKTTEGGIDSPYYITANEVSHSRKNSDVYRLYRIYNFNPKHGTGDLYILEGDITQRVELKPKTYISAGLKK